MEKSQKPDYKKIYTDLLNLKFPEKKSFCQKILSKATLSVQDVLQINTLIFPAQEKSTFKLNQQHRSYDRSDILEILDYQKTKNLNNTQLANYFKISRNTIARWKKMFISLPYQTGNS
ncbi:helix-turn-helix domain-containing protein [Chryseobacterium herbae]|uniref:Helix-turn-helix domain-containing protein n=1 Tax=Chryseobacterium herbae TaxID=2976476 RepID=A0ABT2INL7_9FLAO|nr:helix-turn-helix domain-containing protein [Chryseobacterium sp. pc1-10]MCT2560404.1 helix-turn-helix domain-containing protein [Chryseobacterium sp. pc1-10]